MKTTPGSAGMDRSGSDPPGPDESPAEVFPPARPEPGGPVPADPVPADVGPADVGPATTSLDVLMDAVPARRTGLAARQRVALTVAVVCALVAAGGLGAATLVKSPAQVAAETAPPDTGPLTAEVQRRVLASTLVTRGTAASATEVAVTPIAASQEAGTSVVTGVRSTVGKSVRAGAVLLEVSGRPLVALPGALPAYRDLKPDADGDDVAQLQRALRALGHYRGGDARGHFGPGTKRAVVRFYRAIGYDAPDTGGPGGVGDEEALTAAQDAVDAAQRAVDAMRRRIAAEPSPAPSAPPSGEEPLSVQMTYLRRTLDRARQAQQRLIARTGPMMPVAEVAFLPTFPARVVQSSAKVGAAVRAPLITLSTGALQVTAKLRPDQGRLVDVGMKVALVAEVIGAEATGTVTAVGAPTTDTEATAGAPSAAGQEGAAGQPTAPAGPAYVPLTVKPAKALGPAWAGQDVRLTITAAQTDSPVLVVPLSAVSAGADGRTTVSKVARGDAITAVQVTAGISGDGFVEVVAAGGELAPGDEVVVGQ